MSSFSKALALFAATIISSFLFAETQYPLTITDGMGNEITLQKQPLKISSKTLFTDEILSTILEAKRLTSLTNLAADKNFSNIANQLPKEVALLDFNVEAILNNYPDIVFAANWSEAGKVKQLRNAGIQVYLVNTPFTLEDIQSEIQKLGKLLNVSEEANALTASMTADLEKMTSAQNKLAEKKWVALDYNSWGTSSGVSTTWHAVLKASGIQNGSASFEQGAFGQVPMSKELIVEINPDILFLPGWIYGESDAATGFYNQIVNDPALANVEAIKNKRIYQIPENLRGTYSQYIVDTIEYVIENISNENK